MPPRGKPTYAPLQLPAVSDNESFLVIGVIGWLRDRTGQPGWQVPLKEHGSGPPQLGICARVGEDRTVALEVPALWDSAAFQALLHQETVPLPLLSRARAALGNAAGVSVSAAGLWDFMALQFGVFLLAVCHLVVVVDDGLDSIRSWVFIQTCEMLSKGIADVSLAAEDPPPGIETAVCAISHSPELFVLPERLPHGERALPGASIQPGSGLPSPVSPLEEAAMNSSVAAASDEGAEYEAVMDAAAMDAVCEAVRSRQRRPFSRTVSERGWLEGARRIWVTMPQDLELLYTRMQRTASRG
eukprot:jgi/Astpho2/7466/fgenesh1_pg.00114_%23_74_t